MTVTPTLDELAKAAIEAARHLREDYGLDTPGWTGAEVAMKWARDEFRSAATPEAWLSLSSRVKALEGALKPFAEAVRKVTTDYGDGWTTEHCNPPNIIDFRNASRALSTAKPEGAKP